MSHSKGASANLLAPRILIPFLLVSLIWGSTWLVIRDQIAVVPPSWSVSYRFLIAAMAMFVLVAIRRQPFKLDRTGHFFALMIGFFQFAFNFNFVYNAEFFITSGLVAVLFALLMVPNAILARIFLGQKISGSFVVGSTIAASGISLLFWHEYQSSSASLEQVLLGVALSVGGILSASIANVMQAGERLKAYPIMSILAWAMLWGALTNILISLLVVGPPSYELRLTYWGGIFYLGVIGSVVTFPLYFALIRQIGPGRAAYTGVLIPIVAMVLSTVFEGFEWTLLPLAGAALAVIGLLVALKEPRPRTPD